MITTYYIENYLGEVCGYYSRLSNAKRDLLYKFKETHAHITCLKGQYYAEGRHAYHLTYTGKCHLSIKFIKHKNEDFKKRYQVLK